MLQGQYIAYRHCGDVIAGAFLGRVLSLWAPLVIGPFAIYPANVSIDLLAMLAAVQPMQPRLDRLWRVLMGVSLDGAVFLMIRDAHGYYSEASIAATLIVLFVFCLLAPRRERLARAWREADRQTPFKIWTSLASAAFMIAWMRITYLAVVDIPNDERSFSILGYEFHHISMGLVLLVILEHWPVPRTNRGVITVSIVHGVATGWIFDQALFYAMPHLTEEWYQDPWSLFGAIGVLAVAVVMAFSITRADKFGKESRDVRTHTGARL